MPEFRGREWPPKEGNKAAADWPYWQHRFHEVFDGKDNEDYLHKTAQMTKYSTIIAAVMATGHVTFYDLKGIPAARAIGKWTIPIIGSGIAYTTVAAFLGGIRNKTESKNHFFAGMAAGAVYGTYRQNFVKGLLLGIMAGLYGMFYKDSKINGYTLIGDFEEDGREVGWSWSHKQDYTFMKDYPGYWVRKAPEENKCD